MSQVGFRSSRKLSLSSNPARALPHCLFANVIDADPRFRHGPRSFSRYLYECISFRGSFLSLTSHRHFMETSRSRKPRIQKMARAIRPNSFHAQIFTEQNVVEFTDTVFLPRRTFREGMWAFERLFLPLKFLETQPFHPPGFLLDMVAEIN